jgi:hypothetical protein
MTTRLERAEEKITAGSYNKALVELWYAEAEHRADEAGLRQTLSLVGAVKEQTTGRVWKDAEQLESALISDLERAPHEPTTPGVLPGLSSEGPKSRFAKLWVLGWPPLFIAAFAAAFLLDAFLGDQYKQNFYQTSTSALVLFWLGLLAMIVWFFGCLFLLFRPKARSR